MLQCAVWNTRLSRKHRQQMIGTACNSLHTAHVEHFRKSYLFDSLQQMCNAVAPVKDAAELKRRVQPVSTYIYPLHGVR